MIPPDCFLSSCMPSFALGPSSGRRFAQPVPNEGTSQCQHFYQASPSNQCPQARQGILGVIQTFANRQEPRYPRPTSMAKDEKKSSAKLPQQPRPSSHYLYLRGRRRYRTASPLPTTSSTASPSELPLSRTRSDLAHVDDVMGCRNLHPNLPSPSTYVLLFSCFIPL